MIQVAHDLNLFNKTLFSVLFAICTLFRERFYSKLSFCLYFLDQIHRCEVSLTYFLDGLECLMKPFLI